MLFVCVCLSPCDNAHTHNVNGCTSVCVGRTMAYTARQFRVRLNYVHISVHHHIHSTTRTSTHTHARTHSSDASISRTTIHHVTLQRGISARSRRKESDASDASEFNINLIAPNSFDTPMTVCSRVRPITLDWVRQCASQPARTLCKHQSLAGAGNCVVSKRLRLV